ncbi:Orm1 type endoplasmic reticulum protein [Rhizoctonia solani]|uniref:Orm1 type endoplasmic reticulum protein n=1 Tax=Rhizoctonia solani TaxID=456999 RepID=A0A8H7IL54_9AGAM|nr:Orm1 type endoplasmic reticulum protein [Rhizoctonia solani]
MSSPRASVPPPISIASKSDGGAKGRARSSSIVAVQEVGGNGAEEMLDQSVYINRNSEWVNGKGAWIIHPMLTLAAKVLIDVLPGVSQEASWTIVNLGYLLVGIFPRRIFGGQLTSNKVSYVMFHGITGIPFDPDLHGGAYDDLTMWEQIDQGAHPTIGPNSETSAAPSPTSSIFGRRSDPIGAATPMTPMTPSVSGTNTPTYRRSWQSHLIKTTMPKYTPD